MKARLRQGKVKTLCGKEKKKEKERQGEREGENKTG